MRKHRHESICYTYKALWSLQIGNKEFSASINQYLFCGAPLQLPPRQLTQYNFGWQIYRYRRLYAIQSWYHILCLGKV